MRAIVSLALAVLGGLTASVCPALAASAPATGTLYTVPVKLELPAAREVDAEEGWLFVPAHRPRPGAGVIETEGGGHAEVAVTALDLQRALRWPLPDAYERENLEAWPRFVWDLWQGDLRHLAQLALGYKQDRGRMTMIELLIDNSLGVSERRDLALMAEEAVVPLGAVNRQYRDTRDLTPTITVDDGFRENPATDVPIILLQGDIDLSTPYENAVALLGSLQNGHLALVNGASHGIGYEVVTLLPELAAGLTEFIADGTLAEDFSGRQSGHELPPFQFRTQSLY